jgi:hypothetical protein
LILKSQTFNAFILMFVNHFLLFQALSQQWYKKKQLRYSQCMINIWLMFDESIEWERMSIV